MKVEGKQSLKNYKPLGASYQQQSLKVKQTPVKSSHDITNGSSEVIEEDKRHEDKEFARRKSRNKIIDEEDEELELRKHRDNKKKRAIQEIDEDEDMEI